MIISMINTPDSTLEWVLLILALVAAMAVVGFAVWTAIKLVKNNKLTQIKDAVVSAVKEAERTHKSGAEKKEIAVKAVKEFCTGIGLNIDERLLSWIASYIDKYIADHNELEEIEEQEAHL